MDGTDLSALRDEMTSLFVGRGAVVGVAESGQSVLTVLLSADDAEARQRVQRWAVTRKLDVDFVISGAFR